LRTKQEETERKELIKKGQKQEKRMKTKIERSYIRSETKEKHTGKKKKLSTGTTAPYCTATLLGRRTVPRREPSPAATSSTATAREQKEKNR
jgi:hypothetical protein